MVRKHGSSWAGLQPSRKGVSEGGCMTWRIMCDSFLCATKSSFRCVSDSKRPGVCALVGDGMDTCD